MFTNNHHESINPKIVQEAIEWMVKLQSGVAKNDDFVNCKQWRKQNPLHDQAWQQLESLSDNFKTVPSALAHATLDDSNINRKLYSRRAALKSIALMVGVGTIAMTSYKYAPWQPLVADYSTGVGEQRTVLLADGTQIMMNTNSAVDVQFNKHQRLVKLLKGEILVTTGHQDALLQQPFSVQTAQGNVQALGTRFIVRQEENTTLVAVYEGLVEVRPENSPRATRLGVNQQLSFTSFITNPVSPMNTDLSAWIDGVIVATNMRLADFANELDRYRQGNIVCDASAADILISGVFPLNAPDTVIATLEQTLPITAETHMRYWTVLRKRI